MCIVCTAVGSLIIGPWYLVRLFQWHSIAREVPILLEPNALPGSLAQRFQSSKIKLIIGMSSGALVFVLALALVLTATWTES